MSEAQIRIELAKTLTGNTSIPVNAIYGEPYVDLYNGIMRFSGVTGGPFVPSPSQSGVFEVGSSLSNLKVANGVTVSGNTSLQTVSATTIYSGSTNLYDIFLTSAPVGDITRVQPGINTYTGGTQNAPTVNISSATLNLLSVSGETSLGTISATTIYSGSTNLSSIFASITGGIYVAKSGDTMTGTLNINGGNLNITGNTTITGDLVAGTKSFVIPHPTKEGKKLHYGSLEGPEHGVYYRGRLNGTDVIELPEYWSKMVNEFSISVNITPFGRPQKLWVKKIEDNKIYVGHRWWNSNVDCYYTVFAMRQKIDVEE